MAAGDLADEEAEEVLFGAQFLQSEVVLAFDDQCLNGFTRQAAQEAD